VKRPGSSPGSSKDTKSKPSPSNTSARSPRPIEDSARNPSGEDRRVVSRRRNTNSKPDGLPPNENLRKHADEAYGDTEIPERKEK